MNNTIEAGKIVNTHGLRGEVKIVSWCDYPQVFEQFSAVYLKDIEYKIENVKYHKESVILKLSGVDSIDDAEKLKNTVVFALREDFGLSEGEFFIADIIGLKVISEGVGIGFIKDVIQTGANDVYVISRNGKKDLLFPANPETVIENNIESGYIKIIIPEGLEEI